MTMRGRPTTPKGAAPQHPDHSPPGDIPPLPASSRHSTSHPPRRSSLGGFLRRSRSGGPDSRKMPIVSKAAPKLPDLWVNGQSSQNGGLLGRETRDSVAIFSGQVGRPPSSGTGRPTGGYVTGRKSTDSTMGPGGQYVKTSSVPITQDPYANIGSMANRGRYSYASSAVSTLHTPRRIRRRKDPTPFNILVIGARNSGKTSFLRFLRHSLAMSSKHASLNGSIIDEPEPFDPTDASNPNSFKQSYLEADVDGERLGITLWDSVGLEKNVVDLQIRNTVAFIESKFEDTFAEETKVVRTPGITDTHIHCVFLLIDPARVMPSSHYYSKSGKGGLDEELDIAVMRALSGKTIVVPVVSKADTLTEKNMNDLKQLIRQGMLKASVDPLEPLDFEVEDDESVESTPRGKGSPLTETDEPSSGETSEEEREDDEGSEAPVKESTRSSESSTPEASKIEDPAKLGFPSEEPTTSASLSFIPLSIISPDSYEPGEPVGRRFAWGFADPFDEKHCDFKRLKESVFTDWRQELREKSRDVWYENWRSDRLGAVPGKARRRF